MLGGIQAEPCNIAGNELNEGMVEVLESLRHTPHMQNLNACSWSRQSCQRSSLLAATCRDVNRRARMLAVALRGHLHELSTSYHGIDLGLSITCGTFVH